MNFEDLYVYLQNIFDTISPYLISFMGFALPIALWLGDFLQGLVAPVSEYFPSDAFYLYIIVAICIFIGGGYYNFKHPYRKRNGK